MKAMDVGIGAKNMNGCLLPYFDLNRSEIDPTKGSEIASNIIAMNTPMPVSVPGRPMIWL